jgi:hypothetical protein
MNDQTRLHPTELAPDRPFTDPALVQRDLAALNHMRATLCSLLADPDAAGDTQEYLRLGEPSGRGHDVTIARRAALLNGHDFAVVGFFGVRRKDVDLTPLLEADVALTAEFSIHTGVYSYSRLEQEDGNWGNMVVLADQEAARRWLGSERHAYAVRQLAPRFYHSVRLHNVELTGTVQGAVPLRLIRTKYYDYAGTLPWMGVREQRE